MDYRIVRTARTTLCIRITQDAQVEVRVPYRTTDAQVAAFVRSKQTWVEAHLAQMRARKENRRILTPAQAELLRQRAKTEIPARVRFYAEKMRVAPRSISFRPLKSRYGYCTSDKRIVFYDLLLAYPPEAVDYVIVHELAHLLQMNHSKKFYAVLARILPDHAARRALLVKTLMPLIKEDADQL